MKNTKFVPCLFEDDQKDQHKMKLTNFSQGPALGPVVGRERN